MSKKIKDNGIRKGIEDTVMHNGMMTKEMLKERLVRELESCFIFMREILATPDSVNALTESYYKRYVEFKEKEKAAANQTELDLKPEGGENG